MTDIVSQLIESSLHQIHEEKSKSVINVEDNSEFKYGEIKPLINVEDNSEIENFLEEGGIKIPELRSKAQSNDGAIQACAGMREQLESATNSIKILSGVVKKLREEKKKLKAAAKKGKSVSAELEKSLAAQK